MNVFLRHRLAFGVLAIGVVWGAGGFAVAAPSASRPIAAQPVPPQRLGGFVGITPERVLDTRVSTGPIGVPTAAPLGAGEEIDLRLTAPTTFRPTAPVPTAALSVLINVTIDDNATTKSFLTVWPTGEPRPTTSANNAEPGVVSPNLTTVRLGNDGSVSFFNQQGDIDLVVDLVGYTLPIPSPTAVAGLAVARQFEDLARGPADVPSDLKLGSLDLPVGNYSVTATVGIWAVVTSPGAQSSVACRLVEDNGEPIASSVLVQTPSTADFSGVVTVIGLAEQATTVQLICGRTGPDSDLEITFTTPRIVAVSVGTIVS